MDDSFFQIDQRGDDKDRSIPEFHVHPVFTGKNPQGVEQYEDRDYVKILVPGQRDMVDRECTDEDRRRWPQQWEAYKAGREAPLTGYPLEKWGAIGPSEVRMLNSLHLRSVEDVASAPDTALQRIGRGAMQLKQDAIRWIREHESTDSLIARLEKLEAGEGVGPNPSIPAPKIEESDLIKALKIELRETKKKLKDAKQKIRDLRDKVNAKQHEAA